MGRFLMAFPARSIDETKCEGENYRTSYLIHLSTIADSKISNPPWVKFQSARWVFIQSAPTDKHVAAKGIGFKRGID